MGRVQHCPELEKALIMQDYSATGMSTDRPVKMDFKSLLFMTKYSLIKPTAYPYYRQVLRDQFLSRDELESLNWERTKSLLEYAFLKVPYYKARFNQIGLHPDDIRAPEDFKNVPLLTRDDLREHCDDLVSLDARRSDLRVSTTGGSTGEPVKVYHEKRVVRIAMAWRMMSWWGLNPSVDMASIYRDVSTSWKSRFINRAMWWPSNLDDNHMRKFVGEFNRIKPRLIHGYVGATDHLADYILENGLAVASPKAVWVTSAPLTSIQEHRISKAFGAPVYDQYGSTEMYWLAAECPAKHGLHMFADTRKFEFLDEKNNPVKDGELGRIAITDLENRLFPMIRYLNGDLGRALGAECPCGVKLPLMDKVRGRTSDIIRLPGGKSISGDYMTTIFDDFPEAIRQFRVHQLADYSLKILVVPNTAYPNLDSILEKVRETLSKEVEQAVPVDVIKTDNIPQAGGKLHYIKSDVSSAQ
jgi:phenylacetate-CoA ligase